jgi:hypothetical protein
MGRKRFLTLLATLSLLAGLVPAGTVLAAGDSTSRQISAAGTTRILGTSAAGAPGTSSPRQPDVRGTGNVELGVGNSNQRPSGIFPRKPLPTPYVRSSAVAGSNPEVQLSFNGLNHRNQRLANGGNQFSVEPPDQALCVGNGYTVEAVNSVLQVFSSSNGAPLTGVQDLNTFFGYPAAINRSTYPAANSVGPDVIDPVCNYDPDNHRFIVAITTLDVDSGGNFTGRNTIDIAVSNSGNPTGAWTIYSTPAQNNGTEGTPDHHCDLGFCFQDYPHIGGDANGVYITTNEYSTFGNSYSGAQIFAFSKAQLAAHPASITVSTVQNLSVRGSPGFTVWPATSPAGQYASDAHGTEYFLSTIAGDGSETGNPTRTANRLGVWALTNTSSLNTSSPALKLSVHLTDSETYVYPPVADQKPGSTPLADCINDTTTPTIFGPGCWQLFFVTEPAHSEVLSHLDAGDTRMQQTWYANGTLWGSTTTAVKVGGQTKTGIAWFAVDPQVNWNGNVSGEVEQQGYLALANNNLTYPAIAMGTNGKGVIAFTVVGQGYYPSAGYATINSSGMVGPIHLSAQGLGPADGFTSYKAFVGDPPRTRWGDYGAAVTDGRDLWLASEYIGQTCTYAQYYPAAPSTAGFGSCGGTRTSLGNWGTYLTKIHL